MRSMPGKDALPNTSESLQGSGKDHFSDTAVSLGFAIACVVALASLLFVWKAMIALGDPVFTGDAAHRMLSAGRLVSRMGNRVWLPYLQWQIWALARFGVPYPFFNLIPCLHLFIAVLALGLLGLRILGRSRPGLLISLAVMFFFAQQRVIARNGIALYQEITGIALLYLLLYGGALELARRRWLLAAGALALLARDSMWIYLFTLTVLNVKAILSDSRYRRSFAFLWAIPPLWLITVFFGWLVFNGRLPTFPTEWPLMINKEGNQAVSSLAVSLDHLWKSALHSRIIYLAIAGIIGWVVHAIESRHAGMKNLPATDFAHRLKPFTLLSLAICYGLILLFDPWQFTAGSGRMYTPLIEQAFVWFLLIAAAVRAYRPAARILTMTALMGGMLASMDMRTGSWIPVWNTEKVSAYEEIAARIDHSAPGRKPMACMIGSHFYEMSDFVAAIYRDSHTILLPGVTRIPASCDALFATYENAPAETGGLVLAKEYTLDSKRFRLYLRRH
jgi:hypothetical protein